MDIKSKKFKIIGIFITLALVLGLTFTVLGFYKPLWEKTLERTDSVFEDRRFTSDLLNLNYGAYYNLKNQISENKLMPSEVFYEDATDEIAQTINHIFEWNNSDHYLLDDVDFVIVDPKDNSYGNKNLINEINQKSDKELREKYQFLNVLNYDDKGNLSVEKTVGVDIEKVSDELNYDYLLGDLEGQMYQEESVFDEITGEYIEPPLPDLSGYRGIKNVRIIYAVEKDHVFSSSFMNNYSFYNYIWGMQSSGQVVLYIGLFIVTIILAIILASIKKLQIGNGFSSYIPLEAVVGMGVLVITQAYFSAHVISFTMSGYLKLNLQEIAAWDGLVNFLRNFLNFGYWFLLILGTMLCIFSLKQIKVLGLKEYIKTRIWCIGIFVLTWRFIKKICKNVSNKLMQIDFTKDSDKQILKLVIINFILLVVICSFWFFGIPAIIIYSVILFFLVRKYVDKLKGDYNVILEATNEMANGNLDIYIDENVGLLEPLKEELIKVKDGFSKAVDEEVKSQKLKTDLITNVSHDLKTPLTAIITYINLMKDENLTVEDKNKYLDVMEMKSFRLKALIEDLFEISKYSSGNVEVNLAEIDLNNLIKQVILEIGDKLEANQIETKYYCKSENVILNLDSQKTYRIFENLLVNISKYAMPNTRAYIQITEEVNDVIVTVKNISAQELDFDMEEITERFVRGDKSRNTEGSGLGLAIVKNLVEIQNGTLSLSADGDLFKVTIVFHR